MNYIYFDCNPCVSERDLPPASLRLESLVIAHLRTFTSVSADKTIHPWIVLCCRKEHY